MSKIITLSDINSTKFYQLPKAFFHNPKYINMKNESKIAYSLLRDLLDLSIQNNWINENREVYVKLSREKLMKYLNIKGKQKITKIMTELSDCNLIVEKRIGIQKCNEIYICIPDELEIIYDNSELLAQDEDANTPSSTEIPLKFENQTSRSSKIKPQEVRKSNFEKFENQTHINTNYINTNYIKTNINTSSSSNAQSILQNFEKNICELKPTTKQKLLEVIETYNCEFINAVIDECCSSNVRSYNGFISALISYINRDCVTAEDVCKAAEEFRQARKNQNTTNQQYNKRGFVNESCQRGVDYYMQFLDGDGRLNASFKWEE